MKIDTGSTPPYAILIVQYCLELVSGACIRYTRYDKLVSEVHDYIVTTENRLIVRTILFYNKMIGKMFW